METEGQISFRREDATTLRVRFSGTWRLRRGLPTAALVERELKSSGNVRGITFDADELAFWDSSVLTFLVDVSELCRQRGLNMDRAGLPAGCVGCSIWPRRCRRKKARAKRRSRRLFSNGSATLRSATALLSERC